MCICARAREHTPLSRYSTSSDKLLLWPPLTLNLHVYIAPYNLQVCLIAIFFYLYDFIVFLCPTNNLNSKNCTNQVCFHSQLYSLVLSAVTGTNWTLNNWLMSEQGTTKISMHHPVGKFTITFYSCNPAKKKNPYFSLNWKYVKICELFRDQIFHPLTWSMKIKLFVHDPISLYHKIKFYSRLEPWKTRLCFKDTKG